MHVRASLPSISHNYAVLLVHAVMVTTGLARAYYASIALRINFAGVIKHKNKTNY